MAQFRPLTTTPNTVLFINTDASFDDLHLCAMERFLAVKALMKCLSTVRSAGVDETNFSRLAQAAHLLLQEGCDVLDVMEFRGRDGAQGVE